MVVPEIVCYNSFDGLEIPAFLYTPEKPNGAAIVYPHGGPKDQYGYIWDELAQYFTAKGYFYLAPNYRGSTGYGKQYERANYDNWGVGDTQDCLHAHPVQAPPGRAHRLSAAADPIASSPVYPAGSRVNEKGHLEIAGCDVVIIETVGVGQSEVEIAGLADTTLVLLAPGMGDGIQAAKAGILEIADVFVVNKADRAGAKDAVRELKQMLSMSEAEWKPEIVQTIATKGEGIDELWAAIGKHREYQESNGLLTSRRRRRIEREIKEIVAERFRRKAEEDQTLLDRLTEEVVERRLDPYAAADQLMASIS